MPVVKNPDPQVYGYFDGPGDVPVQDPAKAEGGAICACCRKPLVQNELVKTPSVLEEGSGVCWFFHVHVACWEACPPDLRTGIETRPFTLVH